VLDVVQVLLARQQRAAAQPWARGMPGGAGLPPIAGTVQGEPAEIFPFLGSSRLEDPLVR
jgi:hypothetical protein